MKKKILFLLIMISFMAYSQVGIGGKVSVKSVLDSSAYINPRGALHLQGQFSVEDSLVRNVGLVLPKADTLDNGLPNVVTPKGKPAIEGTIIYDYLKNKCVKVKISDINWSDCLVDKSATDILFDYDVYGGINVRTKKLSAGGNFSISLGLDDDRIYVSGSGANYRTGVGRTANTLTFALNLGQSVKDISAGYQHGLATDKDGYLWSWGSGGSGRLGSGVSTDKAYPMKVIAWADGVKAIRVEGGYDVSLVLGNDHKVYAFGNNGTSGLVAANGTTAGTRTSPTLIASLNGYTIADISLSRYSAAALTDDGKVYVWGLQTQGRLGNGSISSVTAPVKILASETIKQVAMGTNHGLAVSSDGKKLYAWGATRAFGIESNTFNSIPQDVAYLINAGLGLASDEYIVSVAVSRFDNNSANIGSSIVITNKNIYAAGSNTNAQRLGLGFFKGTTTVRYSPYNNRSGENLIGFQPMYDKAIYPGTLFHQASIGESHSLMAQTISTLDNSGGYGYGVGNVNVGQLGAVSVGFVSLPLPVLIKK